MKLNRREREAVDDFLRIHDLYDRDGVRVGCMADVPGVTKADSRERALFDCRWRQIGETIREYQPDSNFQMTVPRMASAAKTLLVMDLLGEKNPGSSLGRYTDEQFLSLDKVVRAICRGLCETFPAYDHSYN